MFTFRPLPWEYGIRNLLRRPLRTGLTLLALTTVTLLVMVVMGFVRGLDRSLAVSGDPQTAIVFSLGMGENLEYSSVPMRTADLLASSITGVRERYGQKYASPELYLGTLVRATEDAPEEMGLVRGLTPSALLVHGDVEITRGDWPRVNEVLIGRMAATKLGLSDDQVRPGRQLLFEGRTWTISGTFAAAGSTYESEIWCRLDDLQQAMKRQDLSLVALTLGPGAEFQDVDLFCKERLDLELQAIRQTDYFATLQKDYAPIRWLSWLVVALVSGAGVFIGLNTMYGAVVGRIPELATLQTIGFSRRAAILSVMQEGTVLAMTSALLASIIGYGLIHRAAVRFTMGAFELQIDSGTLLIAYGIALFLGIVGSLPPSVRMFRLSVVDGLKAV
ncbi:MAG: ABC transporter permease [Planctomycetota bacterium]|nr:MAG: ABC transporter permease [Planctomycetota bacterium]REJ91476.1 MAG: ABC transporter permease [Planctomycetota bacterium]REK25561.1 MAG: ABC transporter permease [Planctomycetota bacterium]REK31727.1 MAG: ABC transporter permease [Planctomycetota bacterium]